jgi:hypothetical protein
MTAQPINISFDTRVEQYLKVRVKEAEIEARHKEELAPLKAAKQKLEALFLNALNSTGQDSARTAHGTVYKKARDSASLEDPDAFLNYIIAGEAWHLIDRKANVTAVRDFLNETGQLPPGVKFSTMITVGVLSPKKK